MPNTINGWTSAGLLPSYAVTSQILSGSGSRPPGTPPTTPTAPPVTATGTNSTPQTQHPMPKAPLPSTPAVGGFGNTGGNGGYNGGLPPGGDPRAMPVLTPEQAYARYLQGAMGAMNSTPLTNFLNLTGPGTPMSPGIYGSPSTYGNNTNQPGSGFGFGGAPAQASILQQIAGLPLSPYAMSYGTPAAMAPAPTPQWGYPTAYGQPSPGWVNPQNAPGFGFGF